MVVCAKDRCNIGKLTNKLDKKIEKSIVSFNNSFLLKKAESHGTFDKQSFWKSKIVLAPKSISIPHAVIDKHGNEITDPDNIRHEYRSEFQHRLRERDILDHLKDYEKIQNDLCQIKLDKSKRTVSPDFTLGEVERALKELKMGKSGDPYGLIRELFRKGGKDMLVSIQSIIITEVYL